MAENINTVFERVEDVAVQMGNINANTTELKNSILRFKVE